MVEQQNGRKWPPSPNMELRNRGTSPKILEEGNYDKKSPEIIKDGMTENNPISEEELRN